MNNTDYTLRRLAEMETDVNKLKDLAPIWRANLADYHARWLKHNLSELRKYIIWILEESGGQRPKRVDSR